MAKFQKVEEPCTMKGKFAFPTMIKFNNGNFKLFFSM